MRLFNILSSSVMLLVGVFFLGLSVFAGDIITAPPTGDEFSAFVQLLSGVGGMGSAGIILIVVQGLMLVARQFLQGKYLLLMVSGLTLIASGLSSVISGGSILQGIMSGAGLATMQVFISQLIIQFKKSE